MTKAQKLQNAINSALNRLANDVGWFATVTYLPNPNGSKYRVEIDVPGYGNDSDDFTVDPATAAEEVAEMIANSSLCEFVDGIFRVDELSKLIKSQL